MRRGGRFGKTTIGILTVTEREFAACRDRFDLRRDLRGSYFAKTGSASDDHEVVMRQLTGQGNGPSSHATAKFMEHFAPQYIIIMGTCGGILKDDGSAGREGTRLGDVIVANYIHYPEFVKLIGGEAKLRHTPFDQPSHQIHYDHVNRVRSRDWRTGLGSPPVPQDPSDVFVGGIAVADKICSDPTSPTQMQFIKTVEKVIGIEMESYGVASAIYQQRTVSYAPQYMAIRGISDFANSADANETRDAWTQYASDCAAAFTAELANLILADPTSEDHG